MNKYIKDDNWLFLRVECQLINVAGMTELEKPPVHKLSCNNLFVQESTMDINSTG